MQELDNRPDWLSYLDHGGHQPVTLQALDCQADSVGILNRSWRDSLFLGCRLTAAAASHILQTGGVVIPHLEEFEFPVHRAHLYTVEELYDGFSFEDSSTYTKTLDSRIYRQYLDQGGLEPHSIRVSLSRRLHDHSITDSLQEVLNGKRVVAIMGGHGLERADPLYRQVAELSRELAREGICLISGGGPGAMEACHLGVYLADRSNEALDEALTGLSPRPSDAMPGKEYADTDWLQRAFRVRDRFPPQPTALTSIGIPTWMYGHEPPAPFASLHAKYFANSVREDGLLMWATHGVVFTPGSAGTIQEIFQDACQNHYQVLGYASPMILLGTDYWQKTFPVWDVLQNLSQGRSYADHLMITDVPAEAMACLRRFNPAV